MDKEKRNAAAGGKSLTERMAPYFDLSARVEAFRYKGTSGREYRQEPGTCDSGMTQAMADDMRLLAHAGIGRCGQGIRAAERWHIPMRRMGEALAQAAADLAAGRPLAAFPDEACLAVMAEMSAVRRGGGLTDEGKRFLDAWFAQAMHMFTFSFALGQEADMRAVSRDIASPACGIPERDSEVIQVLFAMKRLLLKTMLRLSPGHDGVFEIAECMESLTIAAEAVRQGKGEQLAYLLRCREAAEEFAEADDEEA